MVWLYILISVVFFQIEVPLLLANGEYAEESGNCNSDNDGHYSKCQAVYGEQQYVLDEEDPESELSEIIPIVLDVPKEHLVIEANSDIDIYNLSVIGNKEISIIGSSTLAFSLYHNEANLTFKLGENNQAGPSDISSVAYLYPDIPEEANEGLIDVEIYSNQNYFSTANDLNDVTFYDNATTGAGIRIASDSTEEALEVHIRNIDGEIGDQLVGVISIDISGAQLYIDGYVYLYEISGNGDVYINGEGKDGTPNHIGIVNVSNLIIDHATIIDEVESSYDLTITINAETEIYQISTGIDTLNINFDTSIPDFPSINVVNIAKDEVLDVFISKGDINQNIIHSLNGEGTLVVDANISTNTITIEDVDIERLIIYNGIVDIAPKPVVEGEAEDGTEEDVVNVIHNIDSFDDDDDVTESTVLVDGVVIIENISYVDSLYVCSTADSCDTEVRLTLYNVDYIESFTIDDGQVLYSLGQDTDSHLHANKVTMNDGVFNTKILDTPVVLFNDFTDYMVIIADESLSISNEVSLFTDLPEWYEYNYFYSADNLELHLEVKRIATYEDALTGYDETDENILLFASYIDDIIESQVPLDKTLVVLSNLDYASNDNPEDTLSQNISELMGISNTDLFLAITSKISTIINISQSFALTNQASYDVYPQNKRENVLSNDTSVWFSYFNTSGDFLTASGSHYSTNYFLGGYNFINSYNDTFNIHKYYSLIYGGGISTNNSSIYSLDNYFFNLGLQIDNRIDNDTFSLTLLYLYDAYSEERIYFSSYDTNDVVSGDIVLHSLSFAFKAMHDIYMDTITFSPQFFINDFLAYQLPYEEDGDAALRYTDSIYNNTDVGIGIAMSRQLLLQDIEYDRVININLEGNILYRYGLLGDYQNGFKEVPASYDLMYSNPNFHGLLYNAKIGLVYEVQNLGINLLYIFEYSDNLYKNSTIGVKLDYKL